MRFKVGDKVEVMNNKDVPVSWHTADILSVNGHKYLVEYDYNNLITSSNRITEMVTGKLVRPRPPPVEGVESYVIGDIVEVFFEYSWKVGTILDILVGGKEIKRNRKHHQLRKQYLVRLLGCSRDLVIDSSNIRMRRTWREGKWILMGKSFDSGDDVIIASKPATSNCFRKTNFRAPQYDSRRASNHPKNHRWTLQDNTTAHEPLSHSPKSLKRTKSHYDSSVFGSNNGRAQKLRAVEKEDGNRRLLFAFPVFPKVEKNMHGSFNVISNGYYTEKRVVEVVGNSELNSSDSDACSVGSCSITTKQFKTRDSRFLQIHCQGIEDDFSSDAESFSEKKSKQELLEVSVRDLELHAYRATLEALYASGPLSWEQEAMLTNLRIMLHISNDEHLYELKHLISTKSTSVVR